MRHGCVTDGLDVAVGDDASVTLLYIAGFVRVDLHKFRMVEYYCRAAVTST